MAKLNLVLLTGLPASGKSTVAERLASQYGFLTLSTDELRQSIFRQTYEKLVEDGKLKEEVIRKIMDYSKLQILSQGFNLVIDTSAPTEKFRRRMLELPETLDQIVNKYLLYIKSDETILLSRSRMRRDSEDRIRNIQQFWSEPQNEFCGASLYEISNNSNLEQLYKDVDWFYESLRK